MINHERNLKEFGQQDVIYSVGLFDYLDDDVLTRLLGTLYRLLSPGGRLITSFKDSRRYATFDNKWLLTGMLFYSVQRRICGIYLRMQAFHSPL